MLNFNLPFNGISFSSCHLTSLTKNIYPGWIPVPFDAMQNPTLAHVYPTGQYHICSNKSSNFRFLGKHCKETNFIENAPTLRQQQQKQPRKLEKFSNYKISHHKPSAAHIFNLKKKNLDNFKQILSPKYLVKCYKLKSIWSNFQ